MTFHEFKQLIQEYNEKHTEFYIEDKEYYGNFSRPVETSRNICIGHIKKVFTDNTLVFRSYSSLPEIREEVFEFLKDFKFKTLFFVPCGKSQLNVYVAKIEGLK